MSSYEPQYAPSFSVLGVVSDAAQFLGSVGNYDLWYMPAEDPHHLRVVWGPHVSQWDTTMKGVGWHFKEPDRPKPHEMKLIWQYVRLFAPDAYALLVSAKETETDA